MTKLEHVNRAVDWSKAHLPVAGILAFSLCSVNSIFNLLASHASHATDMFWVAAFLVELTTAWLVGQSVDAFRKVTRSNISKQDRKFYGWLLVLFIVLTIPSLALSVWANCIEFGGSIALGLAFPGLSVGCALGAALPGASAKYEQGKARQAQDTAKASKERAEQKARASKQQAEQAQRAADERKQQAELAQAVAELTPVARQVLAELAQDGRKSQASIAQNLDVKRQAVGYHIGRLTESGMLKKNGAGYKVLVEVNRE